MSHYTVYVSAMSGLSGGWGGADAPPEVALDPSDTSGVGPTNFGETFTEGDGATGITAADATVTDDGATLASMTITVTNIQDGADETLDANVTGTSISKAYSSGTGVLALTGADTLAHYQQVLRTATWNNVAAAPSETTRSITTVGNDGSNDSNTATTTMIVIGINSLPVVRLDPSDGSGYGPVDYAFTFTEGDAATDIAAADADITDADTLNLESLTITLQSFPDGAYEVLAATTAGTSITGSYDDGSGILALSGTDTIAHYQQVLRTITYRNTSADPNTIPRVIQVISHDGTDPSAAASCTVTIVSVDDYIARYRISDISTLETDRAITFDGNTYLSVDQSEVTDYPLTMVCWYRRSRKVAGTIFSVCDKDTDADYMWLYISASNDLRVYARSGVSGFDFATVTLADDTDVWHFAAGVFPDKDSRTAYGDTETPDTNSTEISTGNDWDRVSIGTNDDATPNYPFEGDVDSAMLFKAALTAAEIGYLQANKPSYEDLVIEHAAGTANCPDPADLGTYWPMNESTGPRSDVAGAGIHLNPYGLVRSASFIGGNKEWLYNPTAAKTVYPFTLVSWFKTTTSAAMCMMGITDTATALYYHSLQLNGSSVWVRSRGGGAEVSATRTGTATDGNWHMASAAFGAGALGRTARMDNLAAVQETTGIAIGGGDLTAIGALVINAKWDWWTGNIGQSMVYAALLNTNQHRWLYNGGAGRTLWEMQNSTHPWNPGEPQNLWRLDEYSGTRYDSSASLNLTDANTVTRTTSAPITEVPIPTDGTVFGPAGVDHQSTIFTGSNYYETDTPVLLANPMTICGWTKGGEADDQAFCWVGDKDAAFEYQGVYTYASGVAAQTASNATGAKTAWKGSVTPNDGSWHFVGGVFVSNTSRYAYYDGSLGAENANSVTFGTFDRTSLGRYGDSTPSLSSKKTVSNITVFSAALTEAELGWLYNSGRGHTYDEFVDAQGDANVADIADLESWWTMSKNNPGGAGEDVHGSLDLTATGSPGTDLGPPSSQQDYSLVSRVVDQTSNAYDLLQEVVTRRPEVVGVDTGPGVALKFTSAEWMDAKIFTTDLVQPSDVFVVHKFDGSAGKHIIYDTTNGIHSSKRHYTMLNATVQRMSAGTALDFGSGGDTNQHVALFAFASASSKYYIDGGAASASGDAGSNVWGEIRLGCSTSDGGYGYTGLIYDMLVNNTSFSMAARDTHGQVFADRYGLSWNAIQIAFSTAYSGAFS